MRVPPALFDPNARRRAALGSDASDQAVRRPRRASRRREGVAVLRRLSLGPALEALIDSILAQLISGCRRSAPWPRGARKA
jgi:hypothetical protein